MPDPRCASSSFSALRLQRCGATYHLPDAWLYSEDDRLEVKNTSTPRAVFGGGPGTDALVLGSGNAIGSIQETGFEAS